MKEEPKPHVHMLTTLLIAWGAVALDGSWWQVPALAVLAVSGGMWAQHTTAWNERKAERSAHGSGGYPPIASPLPPPPAVPPPKVDRGVH